MTLAAAAGAVGRTVLYRGWPGDPGETGRIREVRGGLVFVVYGADQHAKATRPEDIEPIDEQQLDLPSTSTGTAKQEV